MTKKVLIQSQELERAAEKAGGYVANNGKVGVHYNYRKTLEYCKEKNISPEDMTIKEMDQFVVS